MKKTIYPLVNTDYTQYNYQDYLESCETNGIEPAPDHSKEFLDWCSDLAYLDYECDMDNLMGSELKDRWFLIKGKLGLWWGHPEIKPVLMQGIVPAIKYCFGKCDNLVAELDITEGTINVYAYHHDGVHRFQLLMLNKNGEKWAQNAEERDKDIVYNNRWWTKLKSIYDIWPMDC